MIRLALPKGRNLETALAAFAAGGLDLTALASDATRDSRRLWHSFPELGCEVLLLKDRDLPLYVGRGVVDCGIVGRDVLDEVDGDLLVPLELAGGRSRLSLIGRAGRTLPGPGAQVQLATKYPRTAERYLERQPWSAEILELSGSIELAPLVGLADFILDIVQSGFDPAGARSGRDRARARDRPMLRRSSRRLADAAHRAHRPPRPPRARGSRGVRALRIVPAEGLRWPAPAAAHRRAPRDRARSQSGEDGAPDRRERSQARRRGAARSGAHLRRHPRGRRDRRPPAGSAARGSGMAQRHGGSAGRHRARDRQRRAFPSRAARGSRRRASSSSAPERHAGRDRAAARPRRALRSRRTGELSLDGADDGRAGPRRRASPRSRSRRRRGPTSSNRRCATPWRGSASRRSGVLAGRTPSLRSPTAPSRCAGSTPSPVRATPG